MLDPILAVMGVDLLSIVLGHATDVYVSGSAEWVMWGRLKLGISAEAPPIQAAIEYANKHCATLVKGLNDTTKERLAKIIGDGIANKRGIPGIQADIRRQFKEWGRISEMPVSRARMIARTETNDALSQAFMDRAHDMNIEGKEIIVGDPCPICEANASEGVGGVVPIDHIYISGHERPPFHPNCVCGLAPAILPAK